MGNLHTTNTDCSRIPFTSRPRSVTSRFILRANIKSESHWTKIYVEAVKLCKAQQNPVFSLRTFKSYSALSAGSLSTIMPSADTTIKINRT